MDAKQFAQRMRQAERHAAELMKFTQDPDVIEYVASKSDLMAHALKSQPKKLVVIQADLEMIKIYSK